MKTQTPYVLVMYGGDPAHSCLLVPEAIAGAVRDRPHQPVGRAAWTTEGVWYLCEIHVARAAVGHGQPKEFWLDPLNHVGSTVTDLATSPDTGTHRRGVLDLRGVALNFVGVAS